MSFLNEQNKTTDVNAYASLADMEKTILRDRFESGKSDFVGRNINTFDQAMEAAHSNWEEGLDIATKLYKRMKELIKIEIKSSKRKLVFNADDGDVDIDRLMQGDANFMRKSVRVDTTGPGEFSVVVQTTTPWSKTSTECMWRGMAAISAVEILEEAGHKVTLYAIGKNALTTGTHVCHCTLKPAGMPLDRSSLINALSGWYHRTVRFNHLYSIGSGTDESLTIVPIVADDLDAVTPDSNRIYVSDVYDIDDAISLVSRSLAEFGLMDDAKV